ncbi:MAG: hypothetical protein QNJ47_00960 [Nostocaceae cyanobacterium]|nr:hypothetical protein [Nostocaceae cyanobacterium]
MKTSSTPKEPISLTNGNGEVKKHHKLIGTTYRNNSNSDYTENIEELCRSFKYSENSNHYWSEPHQSLLYGSPIYEGASPAQKLALNHLHWFANYNYISNSETETVVLNQVTADVFDAIGYETVAKELAMETEQEHHHIKAFRKIGLMTVIALIGKEGLNSSYQWNSYKSTLGTNFIPTSKYYSLRFVAKGLLNGTKQHYSQYLKDLEQKDDFAFRVPTTGIIGRSLKHDLQNFFTFNWGGGSPFLACQFYALRMIANMHLKNLEHPIAKYFKKVEKSGEFIPAPTAVSHYHFLDESFHTTISHVIAQDMYKDFSKPTAYEKYLGNLAIYMSQHGALGGLSAVLPHRYFNDDYLVMEIVYRLLQSPLFGMSSSEAMEWMYKSFCCEHEGFHLAAKNRQRLTSDLQRFFADVDYLLPVNREMRIMSSRGSIDDTIQNNIKTFKRFSHLVTN